MARKKTIIIECPCCGEKIPVSNELFVKENTFPLNKGMVAMLVKMYQYAGAVKTNVVAGAAQSQWTNYQKLRHWGLMEKVFTKEGKRKGGVWQITDRGREFVEGTLPIPEKVTVKLSEAISFSKKLVFIGQVWRGYQYKDYFVKQNSGQGELFQ